MARKRMIDPSIWDDEDIGSLSEGAFKVFVCLFSNADDHGKIEVNPKRIKGLAFRFRSVTVEEAGEFLDEVVSSVRSVKHYIINNKTYIKLLKWDTYQTVRKPQDSIIPDPKCDTSDAPVRNECDTSDAEGKGIEGKRKEGKGSEGENGLRHFPDDNNPDLILLRNIANYPFDAKKDSQFIAELRETYPDVDVTDVIRQYAAWLLDHPIGKKDSPRARLRNFVKNQQSWQQERGYQPQQQQIQSENKSAGISEEQSQAIIAREEEEDREREARMTPEQKELARKLAEQGKARYKARLEAEAAAR